MNYLSKNADFSTVEDGMKKLQDAVSIRDKMGGAMYWTILNEDCCEIANQLLSLGGDKDEIGKILGDGNYQ